MEKTTFGKTNWQVSRLGFGAAPIGYLETEQDQVSKVLGELLDQGINLIDTAACYPGSEQAIGQAIASRRDQYLLVSKCGHKADDLEGSEWSAQLIKNTIERSLKRLKTDHLDVLLLHSCDKHVLEDGEAVGALVKARDAGKVRAIGYSGDNEAAAYAANLNDIEVIEMSVSIADQANLDSVLPTCQKRDLAVIAKRPIANAAWKDLADQHGVYSAYAKTYTERLEAMDLTPHELGFEGHADVEWPEIALRFTLSQPGVHTAIVGTTSTVNARANIAAAEKGPLPEDTINRIRQAFRDAEKAAGRRWTAET